MNIDLFADCLKGGLSSAAEPNDIAKFLEACQITARDLKIDLFIDSGLNNLQTALVIRSIVMERVGLISETLSVALSRGYLLPDSPFPKIDQINSTRPLFVEIPLPYNDKIYLYNAAIELSKIAAQYKDGTITFPRKAAAQLSSYEVSVDGIAPQSGDPLSDILGYQPDGDLVKRKRAIDSLSRLDFSKRKPYMLFTIEMNKGIAICWGKMRDASAYTVSRRDVFHTEQLKDITLDNSSLTNSTAELLADDHFFQAVSFYDWTTPNDIVAFIDDSVQRDTLYSYAVSGIQKKAPASPFIFDVPMTSLFFSPALAAAAQSAVNQEAAESRVDPKMISPYPALAFAIYGDASYGWMLAGCNILAAIRRGDSVDRVRSNSFIGSTADHIFAEAQAGKIVIPSDLTKIHGSIDAAIAAYGVSQTVLSVLDGVGATSFISGKDDPNGIQPTQASVEGSTSGLARILSAIDPETATIDPKLIVAGSRTANEQLGSESSNTLDVLVQQGTIDLTTHSGIGRFMQVLRAVYDFYPGAFV